MILHELGDDLVLLNEFGLEVLDLAVLGLLDARRPSWPVLERLLGLVEDELDPVVDLAGLKAELMYASYQPHPTQNRGYPAVLTAAQPKSVYRPVQGGENDRRPAVLP